MLLPSPRNDDAVLGDSAPAPVGAVVLGGLAGVRQRFGSAIAEQRIAAIWEATTYGTDGLDLVIQALRDKAIAVQKVAYHCLQNCPEAKARRALQHYDPYMLFESLAILEGHTGGVTAVAISADGRSLISAGRDKTIHVWHWRTAEKYLSLKVQSTIYTITISADQQTFATRDSNQTIRAWSLNTGQAIQPELETLRHIASVTVSQDRHLISGSQNSIKIWDLEAGRQVCSLRGHASLVTAVAVNMAQQLIVSGSEDRTVECGESMKPNEPRNDDVVFGNQAAVPMGAVILGGLEGLRKRLSSDVPEQRAIALPEALQHGQRGLNLVVRALGDRSALVRQEAYALLRYRSEPKVIRAVQEFHGRAHYSHLQKLLAAQQWQIADQETRMALLRLYNLDFDDQLRVEQIAELPCTDLHVIDQLWVKYSQGRFGFSVQRPIWQKLDRLYWDKGEVWRAFANVVGWRVDHLFANNHWKRYREITFHISAPVGHLHFLGDKFGIFTLEAIIKRLNHCQ